MIPNRPAPRLSNEGRWSKDFVDFVSKCLVKDPNQRATAKQLLEVMMLRSSHAQHPFVSKTIQQLKSGTADWEVMQTMIHRLRDVKARFLTTEREKKKAENAARPRVAPQPVPKPSVHAVKPPVVKPPVSVPEEEDNTGTMIMRASTEGSENHSVTSHSLHRAPSESSHPTHAPREPNTSPSQQPPGVIMLNSQAAVLKSKPRSNLSPPVLQSPVKPLAQPSPSESKLRPNLPHSPVQHLRSQTPVDTCTSLLLPKIPPLPVQRPKNNMVGVRVRADGQELVRLHKQAIDAQEQFKEDLQILVAAYRKQLDDINKAIRNYS